MRSYSVRFKRRSLMGGISPPKLHDYSSMPQSSTWHEMKTALKSINKDMHNKTIKLYKINLLMFFFSIVTDLCCSCNLSIENDLLESRGLKTSNCPFSDHCAAMLQTSLKLLWTTPRLRWRSSHTKNDACSTKSADSTVFHVYTWSPWPNNWYLVKKRASILNY